jgi:CRISPR-associated protein Cas2
MVQWEQELARAERVLDVAEAARRPPVGWWIEAFADPLSPSERRGHPCGVKEMLIIVAYDISDPRRLAQVAKLCLDFGVRVQYSIFECRLTEKDFLRFWEALKLLIEFEVDRVVAYKVCAGCAKDVLEAGVMVRPEGEMVAYVV